jgi:hypothetical protein
MLIADTLRFLPESRLIRTTVFRASDSPVPVFEEVIVNRSELRYKIDGKQLTLYVVCPMNANCIGPIIGEIDIARVSLPFSVLGDKAGALVLARVE